MIRRMMQAFLIVLVFSLSACAPATATLPTIESPATSAPAGAAEPVRLKVGVLSFMSHSPVHIAFQDGYFAEQGLDVELVDFGTSDKDMFASMLSGQLDAGAVIIQTPALHAIEQGGNLRFVADKGFVNPEGSCYPDAYVGRKALVESGALDTPANLRGLKMVNSVSNMVEYVNDLMLAEAGLTVEDVEIVDMRDQVARLEALGNGSLDLYASSEPWITRALNSGNAAIWRPLADYIPNYSLAAIMYGPGLLERDHEVGVRFMVAYLKAVQQYNEGKTDRNLEIIAGFTQLTPAEVEQMCWTSFKPDGTIDPQGLTAFQQWALQKGYIDSQLSLEQIWDPSYVEAAYAIVNQ